MVHEDVKVGQKCTRYTQVKERRGTRPEAAHCVVIGIGRARVHVRDDGSGREYWIPAEELRLKEDAGDTDGSKRLDPPAGDAAG